MNALTETGIAKAAVVIFADTETQGVDRRGQVAGVPLLEEYDRPPSFRRLVRSGYEVVTF